MRSYTRKRTDLVSGALDRDHGRGDEKAAGHLEKEGTTRKQKPGALRDATKLRKLIWGNDVVTKSNLRGNELDWSGLGLGVTLEAHGHFATHIKEPKVTPTRRLPDDFMINASLLPVWINRFSKDTQSHVDLMHTMFLRKTAPEGWDRAKCIADIL